jgi:fission 1 protein
MQCAQTNPDFRQAEMLSNSVDNKILKEGLIGMGIGAAVVGVGLAVLFGTRK